MDKKKVKLSFCPVVHMAMRQRASGQGLRVRQWVEALVRRTLGFPSDLE